jgi:hypothetical protein
MQQMTLEPSPGQARKWERVDPMNRMMHPLRLELTSLPDPHQLYARQWWSLKLTGVREGKERVTLFRVRSMEEVITIKRLVFKPPRDER